MDELPRALRIRRLPRGISAILSGLRAARSATERTRASGRASGLLPLLVQCSSGRRVYWSSHRRPVRNDADGVRSPCSRLSALGPGMAAVVANQALTASDLNDLREPSMPWPRKRHGRLDGRLSALCTVRYTPLDVARPVARRARARPSPLQLAHDISAVATERYELRLDPGI